MANEEFVVRYQPTDSDRELTLDLSDWPGSPQLRAAFAEALRHVTGPIGTWQRTATVTGSTYAVKSLVVWLAQQGVASVSELTSAFWNDWRVHLTSPSGSGAVTVMSGRERLLDSRVAALALPGLRQDTARAIEMRIGRVHRVGDKPFYTKAQFEAIQKAAMRTVRAAHCRITANWRLVTTSDAEAAGLPVEQQRKRAALQSLMRHGEPQSREECVAAGGFAIGATGRAFPARGKAFAQLWLTRSEGMAAATWLATLTGEDWSVIHRKKLPSTAASLGDGETVLFTRDSKPRRGPHPSRSALTLARRPRRREHLGRPGAGADR